MNIVGRRQELVLIEEILTSKEPELVALWGRRRIGKTFLLKYGRGAIKNYYFEVTGQKDALQKVQLAHFNNIISEVFYSGQRIILPRNWNEAFDSLKKAINVIPENNIPVTLFFDEAAWLDSRRSGFLNALEHFWNTWASNTPRVKLFICSSTSSWIVGKILKGKGGWHRRVTRRIHLQPFNLSETKEYLQSRKINLSDADIINLYMILGGTAAYLKQVKRGLSLTAIVNDLFFTQSAFLKEEFDELFYSLFNSAEEYIKIVKALSLTRTGFTKKEIRAKTKIQSGGHFSNYISNLEQSDFIESYTPFGKRIKKYRLKDFYSLFYLTWIKSRKQSHVNSWQIIQESHAYKSWAGLSFETLCWNHIKNILANVGLANSNFNVSKFEFIAKDPNKESAQIDLLVDVNGAGVYILELKHHNKEFIMDSADRENLLKKRRVLSTQIKQNRSIFILLLCSAGVSKNENLEQVVDKVISSSVLFD